MHLLSPFSLNLPLYEHKKRPSYRRLGNKICHTLTSIVDRFIINLYWYNHVDCLLMTEKVLTGTNSTNTNKQAFETVR